MFTVGRDKQQDQIRREPRRSQPGLIALGGSGRRDKRGPGSGPPALRKQPVPSSGRSEPALSRAPPTDRAGALGARGARTRGTAAWAARGREHIHRGRRLWDAVCRGSAVPPRPKTPQTPQNQPKPPGCEHPRERRGHSRCWPRPRPATGVLAPPLPALAPPPGRAVALWRRQASPWRIGGLAPARACALAPPWPRAEAASRPRGFASARARRRGRSGARTAEGRERRRGREGHGPAAGLSSAARHELHHR